MNMRHFLSYALIFLLLMGCTTTRYIPVESYHTDSIYVAKAVHDTLQTLDSVYIREKGDTVYYERWRTQYKSVLRVDTCWMQITDSIKVPYEVVVEKKEKTGLAAFVAGLLMIVVLYLIYRRR